mgnify:CR=1 FL=1
MTDLWFQSIDYIGSIDRRLLIPPKNPNDYGHCLSALENNWLLALIAQVIVAPIILSQYPVIIDFLISLLHNQPLIFLLPLVAGSLADKTIQCAISLHLLNSAVVIAALAPAIDGAAVPRFESLVVRYAKIR